MMFVLVLLLSAHLSSGFRLRSPELQPRRPTTLWAELIVGVNKYSHDASCCIVDAHTGEILFTQAKERITGKKHDGGSVGSIVRYGLQSIGADIQDVHTVVSNNHHFRVHPFEARMLLNVALNYVPASYDDEYNLLPNALHLEISHHLAHAWSAVGTAPFDHGLVLVMDGMGESYQAMMEDSTGAEERSGDYMHDLKLLRSYQAQGAAFVGQPVSLLPGSSYREAESAYVFDRETAQLRPVFKRWSRERSPSELYNHGFENMESIGAVYSRISSHVLGDWNACGKIMGLAPWAGRKRAEAEGWYFTEEGPPLSALGLGDDFHHKHSFMQGNPLLGDFEVNWEALEGLRGANDFTEARFGELAMVAESVQQDLDEVAMSLSSSLREATGETNIALVGGVALNSVTNGKITQGGGFEQVYVPSAPGDEGIALGCALYGLQRVRERRAFESRQAQRRPEGSEGEGSVGTLKEAGGEEKMVDMDGDEDLGGLFDFPRSGVDQLLNMDPNLDAFAPQPPIAPIPTPSPAPVEVVPIQRSVFSAYQGREHGEEEVRAALYEADPWLTVTQFESAEEFTQDAAQALAEGKVLAWFQGRSEFGQRALGARSILADPREASLRRVINEEIKQREWYRPLAPSVLDEEVGEWFEELASGSNASPYMSLTATVRADKVSLVPAICHVDNTARLQTVTQSDAPLFHALISAFFRLTGIPMLLNTSFNRKGQPVVESPAQAIDTLMSCGIDHLYLGQNKISVRPMPFELGGREIEPDEREGNVIVRASAVFLSEVTSRVAGEDAGPLRVRIQDAASEGVDLGRETAEAQGSQWRTLPSELHLDVLQLLQEQGEQEEEVQGMLQEAGLSMSEFNESDLVVSELLEALRAVRGNEEEGLLGWSELRSVLGWLYLQRLVHFEDPSAEVPLEQLFNGAKVMDLRSL
ncbi:Carbamoyltransferase-domain-containing protein [Ochromonadaceae sp. CCMP2298]|nr:Carbamoyltransferase-domain-containing protein [Ochromonadaceae sp. CCMP2298]